jgi:hypothetical protein
MRRLRRILKYMDPGKPKFKPLLLTATPFDVLCHPTSLKGKIAIIASAVAVALEPLLASAVCGRCKPSTEIELSILQRPVGKLCQSPKPPQSEIPTV